jgi:DNA (cytosine-5)-methyltransferase 1
VTAYYNELDPKAAAWLRELIKQGHIAPGEVDERSIEDVRPDELLEFTQCHFFAGIGVWSHALRRAGWSDDRPVWTGSCPCQPFSAAGKRTGLDDERHLWPAWFHLISQCRPPTIFGEQVASKDGLGWLDLVQSDMEAAHYAFGAFDLCAAGVGAPHIRQRLYFVAHSGGDGLQGRIPGRQDQEWQAVDGSVGCDGPVDGVANTAIIGRNGRRTSKTGDQPGTVKRSDGLCDADWLADADGRDACAEREQSSGEQRQQPQDGSAGELADACSASCHEEADGGARRQWGKSHSNHLIAGHGENNRPSPTNGHWRAADWLYCTDGKWRPVESGTFPLVDGASFRVGSGGAFEGRSRQEMLRGYGNAIVAPLAQAFIEEFMSLSDA